MVAMVIVMIVFGLSSIVMVNMANAGISATEKAARALATLVRNETISQHRYLDETIVEGDVTIEKTILEYKKGNDLKVLLIEAYNQDEKLFENKELILMRIE